MLHAAVFSILSTIVSLASSTHPPRLAAVDARGKVLVRLEPDGAWQHIHECTPETEPDPDLQDLPDEVFACAGQPRPAAVIAWVGKTLYLACANRESWLWREGMSRAQPAVGLSHVIGVQALAGWGEQLIIADRYGLIWRREPGARASVATRAPEPVVALAGTATNLAVAGRRAVWMRTPERGIWLAVATTSACALSWMGPPGDPAATLWMAGGDGLVGLVGSSVRTPWTGPATGVASWDRALLVVSGGAIQRIDDPAATDPDSETADPPPAESGFPVAAVPGPAPPYRLAPLPEPSTWRSRARWSVLVPDLSVRASLTRTFPDRFAFEVWVWLTFAPETRRIP